MSPERIHYRQALKILKDRLSILGLLAIAVISNAQSSIDSLKDVVIEDIVIKDGKTYVEDVITLNRSQFLTHAASFDDPSRLLSKYPGIVNSNDQSNTVVYEGLPSHFHKWQMYGGNILNPNHLSNAGTSSDLPSRSAGGVNMISGQVIGSYQFYGQPTAKNLFSLAGTSDLKLRKPYKKQFSTNISLLGIEVGFDNKISDTRTFMINYRYSTVGLLTKFGLDFGGESINYHDLSVAATFKNKRFGVITMYGILGFDSNYKEAIHPDLPITEIKDKTQVDYSASNFVFGINSSKKEKSYNMSNTINLSVNNSSKLSKIPNENLTYPFSYKNSELLVSLMHETKFKRKNLDYILNVRPEVNIGLQNYLFSNENIYADIKEINTKTLNILPTIGVRSHFRPFISPDTYMQIEGHLGYAYHTNHPSSPVVAGSLTIKRRSLILDIKGSVSNQLAEGDLLYLNPNHKITNLSLSSSISFWGFNAKVFSHRLRYHGNNVVPPFDPFIGIPHDSMMIPHYNLVDIAKDISGFSIFYEHDFSIFNIITNYTSLYMDDTPTDFGNIFNIQLQKKYQIGKNKMLGIATSFQYRGNGYEKIIDEERSTEWGYTQYLSNKYGEKLKDYQRLDLRLFYKFDGDNGKSSTISLDIQNVLNYENDAYYYYEPLQNGKALRKQLGLIPVLSWRKYW